MKQNNALGFVLSEILLVVLLVGSLAMYIVPQAVFFYQESALEYESNHLLADIRRLQVIAVNNGEAAKPMMILGHSNYQVNYGTQLASREIKHIFLPLVTLSHNKSDSSDSIIAFNEHGELSAGVMTLQLSVRSKNVSKRYIIISKGRVRLERR